MRLAENRDVQWQHAGRAGGAVAVLAAAALWGSTGTVAHFAPPAASPVSVGAARIVAAGALLALIALLSRGSSAAAGSRRGDELRRLLSGAAGRRTMLGAGAASVAGYQLCFFSAVRLTGVAIGTVVAIGSAPVLTGLISRIAGGAALTRRWMAATAGAIAGCAILVTGGRAAGVNLAGVILALLAGLCYASYAVTAARLITGGHSERPVMGALFAGGGVLLLPVLLASSPGWLLTGRGLAVTAELAVLATVAAYLLYARGLRTVQAPVAVTLGLAEPAVAALLAFAVLGERLTWPAAAGLVLVCLALAILFRRRPARAAAAGERQSGPRPALDAGDVSR